MNTPFDPETSAVEKMLHDRTRQTLSPALRSRVLTAVDEVLHDDRLIRRGISDAPMRLFVWVTPVAAAFAVVGSLNPSPVVFLACMAVAQFGYSLSGPAATAIQLVAPSTMRGRLSAIFNVVFYLVGYGLGPSVVALLTTYLYRDPNAVHLSIATTMAVIAPIAWLVMLSGLRPMREAMALNEPDPAADRSSTT